jgi:hypothetical protein
VVKSREIRRIALVALTLAGANAVSAYRNESPIGLRAEVPAVCTVALQAGPARFDANGVALLGTTAEFCNVMGGYTLLARAHGDLDGASLLVDGRVYPLASDAEFVVATSPHANQTSRQIAFDAGTSDGGGQLSLRIVAH